MKCPAAARRKSRRKLSDDKAFGIWKNRKDLQDVAAFVTKLRKSRLDDV